MSEINLLLFCSDDQSRVSITMPFTHGNYTYATDGRVMIRVDRVKGVPFRKNAPSEHGCETTLNIPHDPESDYAIPKVGPRPAPEFRTCRSCSGSGVCYYCGEGKCHECDGDGGELVEADSESESLPVGHLRFMKPMLRRLATLPNVRLYMPLDQDEQRAFVRFDGGIGVVMSRRKDYDGL